MKRPYTAPRVLSTVKLTDVKTYVLWAGAIAWMPDDVISDLIKSGQLPLDVVRRVI